MRKITLFTMVQAVTILNIVIAVAIVVGSAVNGNLPAMFAALMAVYGWTKVLLLERNIAAGYASRVKIN